MKYVAEVFGFLCCLSEFKINGISAQLDDFVDKYDKGFDEAINDEDESEEAEYGCYNMVGVVKEATTEVLLKYNITRNEYYSIAKDVADKVSFGKCGCCI